MRLLLCYATHTDREEQRKLGGKREGIRQKGWTREASIETESGLAEKALRIEATSKKKHKTAQDKGGTPSLIKAGSVFSLAFRWCLSISSGKQASWTSSATTLSTHALQYASNSSVTSVGGGLGLLADEAAFGVVAVVDVVVVAVVVVVIVAVLFIDYYCCCCCHWVRREIEVDRWGHIICSQLLFLPLLSFSATWA